MEFFVSTAAPSRQRTDCAIVGVYDKGALSDTAQALDRRIGGRISRLVKRGDIRGKTGESLLLTDISGAASERILIVGLGARGSFKRKQYRKALASALAVPEAIAIWPRGMASVWMMVPVAGSHRQ